MFWGARRKQEGRREGGGQGSKGERKEMPDWKEQMVSCREEIFFFLMLKVI